MKKVISYLFVIVALSQGLCMAQQYCAYTSYTWDNWQDNSWEYIYSQGWAYAVPRSKVPISYFPTRYGKGDAKDFYFRFKLSEIQLRELSRTEWRAMKKNGRWTDERECTFEYYITDEYQTLKDALAKKSWPCAKYYLKAGKPSVLKTEKAIVRAQYTDDDEVRTLNFFFPGCAFAITVHWDYSHNKMTYSY